MTLIIGGEYQGKLDYAKEKYGLEKSDICDLLLCTEPDFSRRCLYHGEEFVLRCVQNGDDAIQWFTAHKCKWQHSVLIFTDISCGIVPVDIQMRAWREANGRLINWLSREADTVTRLFCGIAQELR